MAETYRVELTKETLVFSAAHFITYAGNICERLHGHNWAVRATVLGPLDENAYVVDFIRLRDALQQIVTTLDHRVLLPTDHQQIRVERKGGEVEARFEQRRWVFPEEDCRLLPVPNTTAEQLARWIGLRLVEQMDWPGVQAMEIGVDENNGQWGICRLDLPLRTAVEGGTGSRTGG